MKIIIGLLFVAAAVAVAVYFVGNMTEDASSTETKEPGQGIRVEEKYGFTSEPLGM